MVARFAINNTIDSDLSVDEAISGDVDSNDFNPVVLFFIISFLAGFTGTGQLTLPTVADNNFECIEDFTATFSLITSGVVETGNLVSTGTIDDINPAT